MAKTIPASGVLKAAASPAAAPAMTACWGRVAMTNCWAGPVTTSWMAAPGWIPLRYLNSSTGITVNLATGTAQDASGGTEHGAQFRICARILLR